MKNRLHPPGHCTGEPAFVAAPGRVIHAIDKDERSSSQIPDRYQESQTLLKITQHQQL
jgi:hypothetical protein